MRQFLVIVCVSVLSAVGRDGPAADAASPVRLRCEMAVDPLGVDVRQPRLSWIVEGDARGERQTAYQVLVASSEERLARDEGDLWDTGRIESDETIHIPYGGQPLRSSQQVFWKVRVWGAGGKPSAWSVPASWTMGVLREADWRAKWIVAPWQTESLLMRREFEVRPGLKRALVHVCGLGQFEMTLNGQKVGTNLLSPGWSKYNKTCLYETHDTTPLVREGANAVGLALGDGMYHTERRNRFSKFQGSFGPQRAIAQIELEYDDGSRQLVVTDETWRVKAGPVVYNDVYGGEDYDARRLQVDWDKPGFDDAAWEQAVELVRPGGILRGHSASAPPLAAIETFVPVSVKELNQSTDVVDFGQNASFMPRITVSGPAGSTMRLTHAEVLDRDGTINRDTCGGNRGPAWWQYTKATDEPETWFPQFFYAGCRYLQVEKYPPRATGSASALGGTTGPASAPTESTGGASGTLPSLDQIEGIVVHSTAEPIGEFECSNPLLNRIRALVRWAQRSNMVSVLTDCPHREKLGWLEQYHLNGPSIRYEFDTTRIFAKAMRDMADSQTDDGLVPNIAPEYTVFPGTFRAAAEWGSAVIVVPWQQYEFTGDTSLMREYYPTMQRYMDYLAGVPLASPVSSPKSLAKPVARKYIIDEGLGDWYDLGPADRPGFAQLTPPPVTATAFYFYDAQLMSQMAQRLGKEEDAENYAALADHIRTAWLREFRHADTGTYATNSQCSNALALVLGLAEPADRESALAALADDVHGRGNAMTAGDVGFRYLLQGLASSGRSDVIYDMINQDERPGYGYQLRQGATSLTEAWDANHHASHNHFMLGHITEWFYKDLVGIGCDPAGPGFQRIIIRPTPVGDLTWARAKYESIRGPIRVRWDRDGDRFRLAVTIPANTTATVYVPARAADEVSEGGVPVDDSDGVRSRGREGDRAVFEIESGSYDFASQL